MFCVKTFKSMLVTLQSEEAKKLYDLDVYKMYSRPLSSDDLPSSPSDLGRCLRDVTCTAV